MSDSIFAHIHRDESALGTTLQGSSLSKTTACMEQFIQFTRDGGIEFSKENQETLLRESVSFQEILHSIRERSATQERLVSEALERQKKEYDEKKLKEELNESIRKQSEELSTAILKLAPGSSVAMPGGWGPTPGELGHGMICEWRLELDGSLTCLFHNTGSGIAQHSAIQTRRKTKFYPVKAYSIPADKLSALDPKALSEYLQILMRTKIFPPLARDPLSIDKWTFDGARLYSEVLPKIGFLGGVQVDPKPYAKRTIQGQKSGTCAGMVVKQFSYSHFTKSLVTSASGKLNESPSEEHNYEFKLQSLIDYFRISEKNNRLSNPVVQRQLKDALVKQTKLIRRLSTERGEGHFKLSEERVASDLQIIQEIKEILNKTRAEKPLSTNFQSIEEFIQCVVAHPMPFPVAEFYPKITTIETEITAIAAPKEVKRDTLPPRGTESLKEYFENCLQFCKEHSEAGHSQTVISAVEQIFSTLPIEGDAARTYWGTLSKEDVKKLLSTVQTLTKYYGQHAGLQGNFPFPERMITALKGMSAACYLAKNYFSDDPNFGSLPKIWRNTYQKMFQKISESPYFITMDPRWDEQYNLIQGFYGRMLKGESERPEPHVPPVESESLTRHLDQKGTSKGKSGFSERDYVGELLNKHADTKKVLEEFLKQDEEKKAKELPYVSPLDKEKYAFYKHIKELEEAAKTNDTLKEFLSDNEFCLHFKEYVTDCQTFLSPGGSKLLAGRSLRTPTERLESLRITLDKPDSPVPKIRFLDGLEDQDLASKEKVAYANLKDIFPMLSKELDKRAFLNGSRKESRQSENVIQTTCRERIERSINESRAKGVSEPVEVERYLEFLHSRSDESCQGFLTESYLSQYYDLIKNNDFRALFLINLFEPELLRRELEKRPEMALALANCIKEGVRYHTFRGSLQSSAHFLIRMSVNLQRYLERYDLKDEFKEARGVLNELNDVLAKGIAENNVLLGEVDAKNWKELEISKRDLYVSLMLRLNLKLEKGEALSSAEMEYLLKGAIVKRIMGFKAEEADPFLEKELSAVVERARPILKTYFERLDKKELSEVLNKILSDALSPGVFKSHGAQWTGSFPSYNCKPSDKIGDIYIDLLSGTYSENDFQYGAVPDTFFNTMFRDKQDFFKSGNKTRNSKVSRSGKICELPEIESRLIIKEYHDEDFGDKRSTTKWQRRMVVEGRSEWYAQGSGFNPLIEKTLSQTFLSEKGKSFWFSQNDKFPQIIIVDDKTQKPILLIEENKICELGTSGHKTGNEWLSIDSYFASVNAEYSKLESEFLKKLKEKKGISEKEVKEHDDQLKKRAAEILKKDNLGIIYHLLNFEDRKFIEIWKNARDELTIRLPRYGLEFKTERDAAGKLQLLRQPNKDYRLIMEEQPVAIRQFPNILYLEKTTGEPPREKIALIPKQAFIATLEQDEEFYKLKFDTDDTARKEQLKIWIDKERLLGDQVYFNEHFKWHFSAQESFSQFLVTANGKLKAQSAEGELHLAYIHLAQHEPWKALKALQRYKKRADLKGEAREIELLRKVMLEIPTKLGKKEEGKAQFSDPKTLAVRAEAASLLTSFKQRNRTIDFGYSETETLDDKDYTTLYKKFCNRRTRDFFEKEFEKEIEKVFDSYYASIENVPVKMRLEDPAPLTILRQIRSHHTLRGPLSFLWRDKELAALKKAEAYLEMLRIKSREHFTDKEEKRLNEVQKQIKKIRNHSVIRSHVVNKSVNVKPIRPFRKFASSEERNYYSALFMRGIPQGDVRSITAADLGLGVTTEEFMWAFKDFYNLAVKRESKCSKDDLSNLMLLEKYITSIVINHQDVNSPFDISYDNELYNVCTLLLYAIRNKFVGDLYTYPQGTSIDDFLKKVYELFESEISSKISLDKIMLEQSFELIEEHGKDVELKSELELALKPEPVSEAVNLSHFLELNGFLEEQSEIRKKFLEDMKALRDKTPDEIKALSDLDPMERVWKRFETDCAMGRKRNELLKTEGSVALKYFGDLRVRAKMVELLEKRGEEYRKNLAEGKPSKEEIDLVTIANQHLVAPGGRLRARVEVEAQERKILKFPDLLRLYLQRDLKQFQAETLLEPADAKALYHRIHHFLIQRTLLQQQERVRGILKKLYGMREEAPERIFLFQQLGEALRARCYEPSEEPEMLVLEFCENKMIRSEQYKSLKLLQEKNRGQYNNRIIQMMMGAGKSTVISPLTALMKATGTNLSVIELTPALFKTRDLQATSERLFGQVGHDFLFTRETDCRSDTLKTQYKHLLGIMERKEYVVTTGESIQSLRLKLLELLGNPVVVGNTDGSKQKYKEWERQVKYLDKMVLLFKNQGDVLIDEVDANVHIRRELNFTVGKKVSIAEDQLKAIVELYDLFEGVPVNGPGIIGKVSLHDVMLGKVKIADETVWDGIKVQLAKTVMEHASSPLASLLLKLTADERKLLQDYIQGKGTDIPPFLEEKVARESKVAGEAKVVEENRFSKIERDRIGLMKEEISRVLISTLKRNPNEHFGFPHGMEATLDGEIACPYAGNNTPVKRAQFKRTLEKVNYTIRLQMANPLSRTVFDIFLKTFVDKLKKELEVGLEIVKYEDTEAWKIFNDLTGLRLEVVNVDNRRVVDALYDSLKDNQKVKKHCLVDPILSHIKHYENTLRADAFLHVNAYRSVQGMTGTPGNHPTWHQKLNFDVEENMGIDGQTIDDLMRKKVPVKVSQEKTIDGLFRELLNTHAKPETVRAFIDVGAFLTGVKNQTAAEKIASVLRERKEKEEKEREGKGIAEKKEAKENELTHVLFFNEKDILCGMAIADGKITEIGSTKVEEIEKRLGCKSSQYFMLFHQVGARGVDIVLPEWAEGVMTIGIDTKKTDIAQGAKRMRKFSEGQNLTVIVPEEVSKAYSDTTWNIETVIEKAEKNEEWTLMAEDNLSATVQKLPAVVQEYCWNLILGTNGAKSKRLLYHCFEEIFLTEDKDDPFEQYKALETDIKTADFLEAQRKKTIESYERLKKRVAERIREFPEGIGKGILEGLTAGDATLNTELTNIIEKSKEFCLRVTKQAPRKDQDTFAFSQSEAQSEAQALALAQAQAEAQRRQELLSHVAVSHAGEKPADVKVWNRVDLTRFVPMEGRTEYGVDILPLDKLLHQGLSGLKWHMDSNIFVTENFAQTHETQKSFLENLKLQFFGLVIEEPDGKISCVLVTEREAKLFDEQIREQSKALRENGRKVSLILPSGKVFSGQTPNKTSVAYQRILEQMRYLNADSNLLVKSYEHSSWLKENGAEKGEFFEKVIIPQHPHKRPLLSGLKRAMQAKGPVILARDLHRAGAHHEGAREGRGGAAEVSRKLPNPKDSPSI